MKNKLMLKTTKISGLVLLAFMTVYSFFAAYKNIDLPNGWKFYCSALGFVLFSSLLVLALFKTNKKN
ncbi:hypothetical protein [Chryseobacterium indologenes]|uniref:Uncharacterized protein n=1 Tax=Chryseobacterium indologenes TaxID=253 RepID=A0A0N0ZTM6_CHRID|nr:hypothetical protein [Chryseobacterium indologenes]KPE50470.1 hypothetical protein AOB46_13835 [Chryseobacterium indologenes]